MGKEHLVDALSEAPKEDLNAMLYDAAKEKYGGASIIHQLIKLGADANFRNKRGSTPLYWAANKGNIDTTQALLKKGAKPNTQTKSGETPLHALCSFNFLPDDTVEIAKLLLDAGANPLLKSIRLFTGNEEVEHVTPRDIIQHTIKSKDHRLYGINPEWFDKTLSKLEKLLARSEADFVDGNAKQSWKEKEEQGSYAAAHEVFGNMSTEEKALEMKEAIEEGNLYTVRAILKTRLPVDTPETPHWFFTPLMRACARQKVDIVRTLLLAKANPNLLDPGGRTPLIIVSEYFSYNPENVLAIAKLLVDFGADVAIRDQRHTDAMFYVIGYAEMFPEREWKAMPVVMEMIKLVSPKNDN